MMLKRQSGLGRGLGALIPQKTTTLPSTAAVADQEDGPLDHIPFAEGTVPGTVNRPSSIRFVSVDSISPNTYQPRFHFDHNGLDDLVESIKEHGILQPLVVSPADNGHYELIAGERRLRASKIAGLGEVPVIVRTVTDQQKLELAIIENVQRQDLNPMEEARAYSRLRDEFNLTQEQVSERVGKSRSQVANIIRLLELDPEIQDALSAGKISQSNARTLLSIPDTGERKELFKKMLEGKVTVRATEERIPPENRRPRQVDPNLLDIESRLRAGLGLKVSVKRKNDGQGQVTINFMNDEDLSKVVDKIG